MISLLNRSTVAKNESADLKTEDGPENDTGTVAPSTSTNHYISPITTVVRLSSCRLPCEIMIMNYGNRFQSTGKAAI